jgi:predicted small secreted protein
MKSVLKTLATTALVAFTAIVFTACNDNRDCAYN